MRSPAVGPPQDDSSVALGQREGPEDGAPGSPRATGSRRQRWRALAHPELLILAGLAVLAAVPRLTNLLALDPFVDEVAWVHWALRQFDPLAPSTWALPLVRDGRPPLHFWLIVLVGAFVDNGFLAGRLAAALPGIGATLALYGLGRVLAGRLTGAVAAILWAVSPFSVVFARVAADDSALAFGAILAALGGALLAHRPTTRHALLVGGAVGLATLAKTLGALTALAPVLAVGLLTPPRTWRRYARPLVLAGATTLVLLLPLLVFLPQMLAQLALHAAGSSAGAGAGASPLGALASRDLLVRNWELVRFWAPHYFGLPFLWIAGLGLLLALGLRRRGMLYVALLGGLWTLVLLDRGASLFGRYLLFASFPLYLLAGYAVATLAGLVRRAATASAGREMAAFGPSGRGVATLSPPGGATSSAGGLGLLGSHPNDQAGAGTVSGYAALMAAVLGRVAAATMVLAGIGVALWPIVPFTVAVVRDPANAPLPQTERFRYVEQWYAIYGLGVVADYLRAAGREHPVTVVVPQTSREERVLIPHEALRLYLRAAPEVRFVDTESLYRARELRELRRLTRDGPTYLLANSSYTDAPGTPNDVPEYTRRLESSLARDVPDAREVLRIPRPGAPNGLVLYRLDRSGG